MRKLKFRVWHSWNDAAPKEMEEFELDELYWRGESTGDYKFPKDLHVMEWTDLTDINDTPIWEGDILKSKALTETQEVATGVVEWVSRGFIHGFYLTGLTIGLSEGVVKELKLEVIGNRYQHPELLERNL